MALHAAFAHLAQARYTQGKAAPLSISLACEKRVCVAIGEHERLCAAVAILPMRCASTTSQGWSHSVIENLLSLHGSCPVVNGSDAAEVAKWTAQVCARPTDCEYTRLARAVPPTRHSYPTRHGWPITPTADRCAVRRCTAAPSTMQERSSMREHWCFSAGHGWSASQMVPCAPGQAARRMLLLHAACSAAVPGGDACGRQT